MRPLVWLRVVRASFLTASALPVIVGTAVAHLRIRTLASGHFAAALFGAMLLHAGANLLNEHGDHLSGADAANPTRTPFNGGSGVIQEGLLSPHAVAGAALACLAAGGLLGVYLNAVTPGNVVLALGLAGIAIGWAYSERPLQLGYRGYGAGELSVAVAFGPLPVVGACYVQTGVLDAAAAAASVPIALLIALVLTVNGFPDVRPDSSVGKRTLVVSFGARATSAVCHVLFAGVYGATIWLAVAGVLPASSLLALATAPIAWMALSALRKRELLGMRPPGACALTVAAHGAFSVLFALGIFLNRPL